MARIRTFLLLKRRSSKMIDAAIAFLLGAWCGAFIAIMIISLFVVKKIDKGSDVDGVGVKGKKT